MRGLSGERLSGFLAEVFYAWCFIGVWFGEKFSNGHFLHYLVKSTRAYLLKIALKATIHHSCSYLLCFPPPKNKKLNRKNPRLLFFGPIALPLVFTGNNHS